MLAIVFFLFSGLTFAADTPTGWPDIVATQQRGDARAAQELAEKWRPTTSSECFDLGTFFLKADQPGRALAWLRKADRLTPGTDIVIERLALAERLAIERWGHEAVNPSMRAIDPYLASPAYWLLPLFFLFGAALSLWRSRSQSSFFAPARMIALLSIAMALTLVVARHHFESRAKITPLASTTLRSGPSDQYMELFRVEAGAELFLTGRSNGGWFQVALRDSSGWIREADAIFL